MMQKQIALLKKSDGARGANGFSKIYQITVKGSSVVMSWGKAEETRRATNVKTFSNEQAALSFAYQQMYAKQHRGYKVAYDV